MPKIIDRDKYRNELAEKAAPLFSKYGYNGLGMRAIAKEIGLSKSALYHYFPTKEAFFLACTDSVTNFDKNLSGTHQFPDNDEPIEGRLTKLFGVMTAMDNEFPKELSLIVDYLRGRSKADVANDPSMNLSNKRFEGLIGQFVDKQDVKPVLCLLMGTLLMRYFDGGKTELAEIETWLQSVIKHSTNTVSPP